MGIVTLMSICNCGLSCHCVVVRACVFVIDTDLWYYNKTMISKKIDNRLVIGHDEFKEWFVHILLACLMSLRGSGFVLFYWQVVVVAEVQTYS